MSLENTLHSFCSGWFLIIEVEFLNKRCLLMEISCSLANSPSAEVNNATVLETALSRF